MSATNANATAFSVAVSSRVEADRKAAGVTVAALARATGIPPTSLRRFLAGKSDFTVPALARISLHLDVPLAPWFAALATSAAA